jgi:hypothetical protein
VSHQFNSWFCLLHQAERLAKDPLRYVRDPTQLELDVAAEQHVEEKKKEEEAPAKSERRSKTGFNKRLLKTSSGEEQSFEEARAKAKCYTIASLSVNFSLLQVGKADQSSQMLSALPPASNRANYRDSIRNQRQEFCSGQKLVLKLV